MSFVFYDTETTGLEPEFDQILQFAAIRTDANLNVNDRLDVRSRLSQHVVPHPAALRTNGITIERLLDQSLPSHYEMTRQIQHTLRSWSPAIFLGYNSIRFDEHMLRQALFQTLHHPFLTSSHQNSRGDVMGLVQTCVFLAPNCLAVERREDGSPVLNLDSVACQNGIQRERIHDAMSDAEATLGLCRIISRDAPEIWSRLARFANKAAVAQFLRDEDGVLLTEIYRGDAYHTPVAFVGTDPKDPNCFYCVNVGVDLPHLRSLGNADLAEALRVKGGPLRRVRVNASPTLAALDEFDQGILGGLSVSEVEERARAVRADVDFCDRLVAAYVDGRGVRFMGSCPEQRLYDGFPSKEDEQLRDRFHAAPWPQRPSIVDQIGDERLRVFGYRTLLHESPGSLTEEVVRETQRVLVDRLLSPDKAGGMGRTLADALIQTCELLAEAHPDDVPLLTGYRDHLQGRISRLSTFRERRFGH
jgi:exodeoxyribonuclease-1